MGVKLTVLIVDSTLRVLIADNPHYLKFLQRNDMLIGTNFDVLMIA